MVYSGHIYAVGSSGRVCRLLDLKDVFRTAWVKVIEGLINFHAKILYGAMHLREESQIDFAIGNVLLHTWGMGVLHKNVSQILARMDFSSREVAEKTLSVRENIIGNIHLGQTSHLNLDKFGLGNNLIANQHRFS